MIKILKQAAVSALVLLGLQSLSGAQTLRIFEKSVDHFEAKVQTSQYLPAPIWINSHQLVASVFKKGERLELYDQNDPVDTVLIDFQRKVVKVIAEGVFAWTYKPETNVLIVGRVRSEFPSNEEKHDRFKELILEEDGSVKVLKTYDPGTFPAYGTERPPKGAQVRSANLQDIGFFLRVPPGARNPYQLEGASPEANDGTLWIRPGKPPLPLKLRFKDFPVIIEAVLFANGYLLDVEDTYGKPFRLLNDNGEIASIPYPQALYGLRYPFKNNGERTDFVYVHLTKSGLMAQQIVDGENRLYLLKDDAAVRLVGDKGVFGVARKKLMLNAMDYIQVGPNGCNVAYQYREPQWGRPMGSEAYSMAILNVCKEENNE